MELSQAEFEFTVHAKQVILERKISTEWVFRALRSPVRFEQDSQNPELAHSLCAIPENGNRVLRVVYNSGVHPKKIITCYFDRKLKGKL
jgi:hypothetical protein